VRRKRRAGQIKHGFQRLGTVEALLRRPAALDRGKPAG
jgi:hypothetical protein